MIQIMCINCDLPPDERVNKLTDNQLNILHEKIPIRQKLKAKL